MFSEEISKGRRAIILIALFCVPFFINLGANSLWDGNEGFFAEPPREILESGNYLIPTYNYVPRFKKPPLTTWVIAGSYKIFGVSEFAERLPAAIAAVCLIFLIYQFGKLYANKQTGIAAALILATMVKFLVYSRQFSGEVFILLFVSLAIYYFARAMLEPEYAFRHKMVAYIAIGFGILTKGPIALFPIIILGFFLIAIRQYKYLKLLLSPLGYLIVFLIGLSWYLMMYLKFGWQFIQINIIQEAVMRYTTDSLGSRPIYYYVGVYFSETLPWSLFIIPAGIYWGRWLMREYRRLPKIEISACLPLLPIIWFGFVFVFFSLSTGKRANYMTTLYPAAALIIGHYLSVKLYEEKLLKINNLILWLLSAISLFGAIFIFGAYQKLEVRTILIYLPITVLIGLACALVWLLIKGKYEMQLPVITISGLFLVLSMSLLMPKIEYYRPLPRFSKLVKSQAGKNDDIGTFFVDTPSLMFYTERKIFESWDFEEMLKLLDKDKQIYFVTREDYLQQLQSRTTIPLVVIDSQQLLQLKWDNFSRNNPKPTLKMVLVRKG